jgi:hypothetical protein
MIVAVMDAINSSPQTTSADKRLKRFTDQITKRRRPSLLELLEDDTAHDGHAPPVLPTRSKRIATTGN